MRRSSASVLCVMCIFAFWVSLAMGQEEPSELTKARKEYAQELAKATKTVNERYLPKLEELKKQHTLRGDIKGALAIEQATEKMAAGQPLTKGDNDSQEMNGIRKDYNAELATASKPVTSLYVAKLEVLKQQLAQGGNLKGALAVEKEMDEVNKKASKDRNRWVYEGGDVVKTGPNTWVEHFHNVSLPFHEVKATEDFIELFDSNRPCRIKLYDDRMEGIGGGCGNFNEWRTFHLGHWE